MLTQEYHLVCHVASDGILQFSINRTFSWSKRLGKSIVLNSLFQSKNIFVSNTTSSCGRVGKNVSVKVILLRRIDRIESRGPVHPVSLLRFSKMFLRISMNATHDCNRLDLQSDYSFITNN